jgi:hypothetical protein
VELVDNHRANCPPQGTDDARHRRSSLFSSSFPSSWLMIATPFELVASNGQGICHYGVYRPDKVWRVGLSYLGCRCFYEVAQAQP